MDTGLTKAKRNGMNTSVSTMKVRKEPLSYKGYKWVSCWVSDTGVLLVVKKTTVIQQMDKLM